VILNLTGYQSGVDWVVHIVDFDNYLGLNKGRHTVVGMDKVVDMDRDFDIDRVVDMDMDMDMVAHWIYIVGLDRPLNSEALVLTVELHFLILGLLC
jgi:hypothetical protein